LDSARRLGYRHLSLSGGEPFLYPQLADLLRQAKSAGWSTSAVTNGTLLDERAGRALELLDLVAVSVDGRPQRHNALRASATAFRRMLDGLARLRETGRPFALVHTLTRSGIDELGWLLSFAREQGASSLRLHPLEAVGGGRDLDAEKLTSRECAEVYLQLRLALGESDRQQLPVHVDLVNRERIRGEPATIWRGFDAASEPWAVADPLVVEPDGTVVPFAFGVNRRFALGHLSDLDPLGTAGEWRAQLRPLVEEAVATALQLEWPFLNWYEHLAEASHRLAGGRATLALSAQRTVWHFARSTTLPGLQVEAPIPTERPR
jgi:MoaA/NifB/PqqE/SkfB family radical SAM enzyme